MGLPGFLSWLATLDPLWQIPIVALGVLAAVGLLLFFIEIAPRKGTVYTVLRLVACVVLPLGVLWALQSYNEAIIAAGVLGLLFFWLDARSKEGQGYLLQIFLFMAPALLFVLVGLVVPVIQTSIAAFMDANGNEFVAFNNFVWIFGSEAGRRVVLNTIVWVLIAPVFSTIAGLAYAYWIDKSRGERIYKVLVFMPMAISFVGASIIWRFMYTMRPTDQEQIGLLNQIIVWFGGDPVSFLAAQPWNNLALIVVFVWVQTGFAMVFLSAAIKGVPAEQLEAAELDGANAWQRFRNVTVPSIRSTLIVVLTTISIASLKVFDIVRTMTAGQNNTSVLANEMYTQFRNFESGRAAALALVLFILVLPLIVYNARQLKKQREIR